MRRAQVRPCYQPPKEEKIKTCHGGYLKTTEGPLPHEVCHNCLAILPLLEKDPKELRNMLANIERPFAIESGIQGLAIISLTRNISRGACEKKALMCGGRIVACVPRHIHRTPPHPDYENPSPNILFFPIPIPESPRFERHPQMTMTNSR